MNNFNFKILFIFLIIGLISSCSPEDNSLSWGTQHDGNSGVPYVSGEVDPGDLSGENFNIIKENPFVKVSEEPVSTFSIDADGASYSNTRRYIQQHNQLPPVGTVRTEELLNYFKLDYDYSDPSHPINLNGEVSQCPWNASNKLIRIGIKGKPIPESELPRSNFVFLIDVSGSMSSANKLDLLKQGFKTFVDEMKSDDRVAIVTYAGAAELLLESTSGDEKDKIKNAISRLGSGGSTAGAEGIITAYQIAEQYFIAEGNNRIIIGTDGDFNVGPVSQEELVSLIEEKRELGIFLTVLGVGNGNYNDAALEQIADNGNGNYEYIDNVEQLKKVFIYEYNKFFTVAKDVKVQVAFNEENIEAYRLIGYENRLLNEEDFEDDKKDAGEISSDQNITAIYEVVPKNNPNYKSVPSFTIDFRYKNPDSDSSIPLKLDVLDEGNSFIQSSNFMKFTASVAAFGMMLNDSEYKGSTSYNSILNWLDMTIINDEYHFKAEFEEIIRAAKKL